MLFREIKENGELDVMQVLDNGYDPFLCDKCKKHGYCIEKFYKKANSNELVSSSNSNSNSIVSARFSENSPITEREISNIVNVRTDIKERSTRLGKKLQTAHDLFHQDEFEQASYMYLDIIETRNDITEAWRGLCASFYFLGKYDDAVSVCLNKNSNLDSSFSDRFIKGCEETLVEGEKGNFESRIKIQKIEKKLVNS